MFLVPFFYQMIKIFIISLLVVCSWSSVSKPNRPKTIEEVAARLKAKQDVSRESSGTMPDISQMTQKDISGRFVDANRDKPIGHIVDEMIPVMIEAGKIPKSRKALEASVVHARRRTRQGDPISRIIEKIFDENPGYIHVDNKHLIPMVRDQLGPGYYVEDRNLGSIISQKKRERRGPKYTKLS